MYRVSSMHTWYLVWTLVHLWSYHEVNAPFSLSVVWIRGRKTSTVGLNWLMWESLFWSDLRKQENGMLENRLGTRTVFFAWSPLLSNTENSYYHSRWAVYLWKNTFRELNDWEISWPDSLVRNIWTRPHQFQRCGPFLHFFLDPSKALLYHQSLKWLKTGQTVLLVKYVCGS